MTQVEHCRRLVEQQQTGALGQRPSQRCPRLLAAGQRREPPGREGFDVDLAHRLADGDADVDPVTLSGAADDDGAVQLTWTVPDDFPTGAATVTLSGTQSDRQASADFTVVAADDDGTPGEDDDAGADGDADGAGGGGDGPLPDTGLASAAALTLGALLVGALGLALVTRRRFG